MTRKYIKSGKYKSVRANQTLVKKEKIATREIAYINKHKQVYYVFTPLKYDTEQMRQERIRLYNESIRPPGYEDINE